MAKTVMTLDNLRKFVKDYVNAEKSAGKWVDSVDSFTNLVDKIGRQVSITGEFNDKLAGLFEGVNLPYGKTVEEYFVEIPLSRDFNDGVTEEQTWEDYKPTFDEAAYSYTLGRKKIAVVKSYDTIEAVCNDGEALAGIEADINKAFEDSYTNTRYSMKEQAVSNVYSKAKADTSITKMVETLAKPVDTETGEAFIESVKQQVEIAKDRNEGNCLANKLIGSAPSLILLVKQGINPSLSVNTLAAAFNKDELGLDVEVRVVDSLGSECDTDGVYAVLIDPRMIQIEQSYNAIRTDSNANKDAIRSVRHYEDTVFISKHTFAHIYKA